MTRIEQRAPRLQAGAAVARSRDPPGLTRSPARRWNLPTIDGPEGGRHALDCIRRRESTLRL